jgi:hypothetical protein
MKVWLLILVMSQPVNLPLHPKLYPEFVYPQVFTNQEACVMQSRIERSAPDVVIDYCKGLG